MANNTNETNDEEYSSNETGSDKSFVGKFMSGLISNTPLSKWFNKSGSNHNSVTKPVIRRRGDENYDDDDDEEDESYISAQPPVKRAKLPTLTDTTTTITNNEIQRNNFTTTPSKVTQIAPSNNNVKVFSSFLEPIAGPSGIQRRKLFINNNIDRNQNDPSYNGSIEQNDTDDSDEEEEEEESTSGYSSSAPLKLSNLVQENTESNKNIARKLNKEDLNAPEIDNNNRNNNNNSSDNNSRTSATIRSLFNSSQDGGRSLFSERSQSPNISKNNNNNNNTSLSTRRPNFNPSILGTPNFVDKTLTTKRILNSPFYNGRTMYGGASALNLASSLNRSINTKTTINNSRASVVIKPTNKKLTNTDSNTTLSKTARRILNTLEQYSTPISDAKKIPISPKNNHKSSSNHRSGILSKYIGAHPYIVRPKKSSTASNKELQIPDLLQMKQKERLQNSTENVRQIAITSKSDLNKQEYKLAHHHNNNDNNNEKHTKYVNKIKNNVRQSKIQFLQNEIVKLPNVTLPITTLPKFDFVLPPPSSQAPPQQQQQQQVKDKLVKSSPIKSNDDNNVNYKFSKPVVISENFKTVQAINNCFKFSEPVDKKQKLTKNLTTMNFKMPENTAKFLVPKLKNNGESSIVKPAPKLVTTGSCIDILKNNNNNNLDKFKPNKDTWECIACLVRNDNDKNQCLACEMEREKSSTDNTNQSSFGDKFKPPPTTWECPVCMIRNKNELNKCEACQTDNPNNKKSTIATTTTTQTTFNFGIPSTNHNNNKDTWECSSCWVRNKNDTDKCIACQSLRNQSQDTASLSQNQQQQQQFNFGDKFKLQSLQTWECTTCMIRNKNELSKCAACETLKPNTEQTKSQFSFGIQSSTNNDWECKSCKTNNKNTCNKCQKCGILKDANNVNKGFGDLFKLKQSEWECTSCLVRNNNDVVKCACCGILKPGCGNDIDTNNIKTEKTTVSFNFGIDNQQNNFKFGIPTTNTSTTTTKTSEEQTTTSASFIFGAPVKTTAATTLSSSSTNTTTTTTTNSFSFGIKPQTEHKTNENSEKPDDKKSETEPVPSFKFGVDNSVTSPKTNETTATFPKKIELPASLSADGPSTKKPTTFEFKPVNGDINKPNLFATTIATTTSTTAITSSSKKDNIFEIKPSITATVTTSAPVFKFATDSGISTTKTVTTAATITTTAAVAVTTPMVGATRPASSSDIFKFGIANIQSTAISSTKRSFGDVSSSSENKSVSNRFGSTPVTTVASPKLPTFELPKTTASFGSNADNKTINFGSTTTKSTGFGTATTSSSLSSGFGSMTNDNKFATSVNSTKPPSFGAPDNKPLGTFSFGNTTDANKTINFGSLDQNKTTVSFGGNTEQKAAVTAFGLNNNSSFGSNETKPPSAGFGGLSNTKPVVFGIAEPKPLVSNFGTTDSKPTFGTTPSTATIEPKSNIFGNTDIKSTSFGAVSSSVQKPSMFGSSEPPKPFAFAANPTTTPTSNQPKSSSFTFGQQQQPNENKLNEVPQPFKFNNNDTNAGGYNFAMAPSPPNPAFNFGNATKTETAQQPAQNQGIFGGSNSSISNNNNGNNNNNGTSWAKSGSFNFGTTANNNNQKAIFTFGASQTNQQQTASFTTQQPTNTAAPPPPPAAAAAQATGFNFGASAPTVSTGGFNFTGPMPTFNFTEGAANAAPPQRKLRKALRRIPR